jgi:hypothetical protein
MKEFYGESGERPTLSDLVDTTLGFPSAQDGNLEAISGETRTLTKDKKVTSDLIFRFEFVR